MNTIRGFFAGSGVEAFSNRHVIDKLLSMVSSCTNHRNDASSTTTTISSLNPNKSPIQVAYIGTATYDDVDKQEMQTSLLAERGCEIKSINVADPTITQLTSEDINYLRHDADIILVSGGNTLYAIRRWEEVGLDELLKEIALEQNENKKSENSKRNGKSVILAGGSAGAICWFTSGHSDSADPSTYRNAAANSESNNKTNSNSKNNMNYANDPRGKQWSYIRVHGLNILPGMICPHFDKTQSNLIPRKDDFAKMLRRHPTEHGIGIDHWAVLILSGDGSYEVYSVPGKSYDNSLNTRKVEIFNAKQRYDNNDETDNDISTSDTNESSKKRQDINAIPSVYTLDVIDGQVHQHPVARTGKVSELIKPPTGPVINDPFERFYAMSNPTPSSGSLVTNSKK